MSAPRRSSENLSRLQALIESTSETLKENKRLARWSVNVDRKEQWDGKSAMAERKPATTEGKLTAADEKPATTETENVNVMGTIAPAARVPMMSWGESAAWEVEQKRARARMDAITREMTLLEDRLGRMESAAAGATQGMALTESDVTALKDKVAVLSGRMSDATETVSRCVTRAEMGTTLDLALEPFKVSTAHRLSKLEQSKQAAAAAMEDGGTSHAGSNGVEEDAARIEKMLGDSRVIDYLEDRLRIRIEAVVEQRIREVEGRMRFKHRQPSPAKELVPTSKTEAPAPSYLASEEAPVSANDLEQLKAHFGKEIRLMHNSLISLRTQVRSLARDVADLKQRK
eukprot:g2032.t1